MRWFSSVSSKPSHSPKVGEPRRRSTTASKIAPRPQRTSFAAPRLTWKCIPRTIPRLERDWLSCTNSPRIPSSSKIERRKVSTKNPRSSPSTFGSISATPSILVSSLFIGARRLAAAPERPDVGDEVGDQPRIHAGRAELLGLHPAADLHAGQHAGLVLQPLDRPLEDLRRRDLDVVDPRLEPVRRRERLAQQQVPAREVRR